MHRRTSTDATRAGMRMHVRAHAPRPGRARGRARRLARSRRLRVEPVLQMRVWAVVGLLVVWCAGVDRQAADGQTVVGEPTGRAPAANTSAGARGRQQSREVELTVEVWTDETGTRHVARVDGAKLHPVRHAICARVTPCCAHCVASMAPQLMSVRTT